MPIYDELMEIKDPIEFERRRQEIINHFIESLPEHRKLKAQQFQFRIERQLHPYKNPISRMNKMVELFWEGFYEFQKALNQVDPK